MDRKNVFAMNENMMNLYSMISFQIRESMDSDNIKKFTAPRTCDPPKKLRRFDFWAYRRIHVRLGSMHVLTCVWTTQTLRGFQNTRNSDFEPFEKCVLRPK